MTEFSNKKKINIKEELAKDSDYRTGRVLSSFNTYPDERALSMVCNNITHNLGDPALFPGTKTIEQFTIKILGDLLHLPANGCGSIVTGGSEANVLALWSFRNHFKKKKSHNHGELEVVAPTTVHVSVEKAADLLGVKLVKVPVTADYRMNVKIFEEKLSENTFGVVAIAGSTILGTVDPIEKIAEICLERDIDIHIDAAFGGLVLPFIDFNESYDFTLEAVKSMTVDIHKMGRVPLHGGGILWRDQQYSKVIEFELPYLSKVSRKQFTLSGSRSGASAIAFAHLWNELGFDGFKGIVQTCIQNTQLLKKGLEKIGFIIPVNPTMNIIGAKTPDDFGKSVEEISTELWNKGWKTTVIDGFLRFVVLPPTTKDHILELLETMEEIVK